MSLQISEETAEVASQSIEVSPLTIHIGAEISGVDLMHPLPQQQIEDIRAALLKWRVIFFRDQAMTHAQHIDFAKQFGECTPGHAVYGSDSDYPEIAALIIFVSKFGNAPGLVGIVTLLPQSTHQWLQSCAVILCRRMEAIRSLQTSWQPITLYHLRCRLLCVA